MALLTLNRPRPASIQLPPPPAKPPLVAVAAGVFLPLITVAVEAVSHMCAEVFFDPLPSLGHLILALAAPLGMAVCCWFLYRPEQMEPRSTAWICGFSFGVSVAYALLFAPITPLALLFVWTGLGLLALSPLLSAIAAWLIRRRLAAGWPETRRFVWYGAAMAVVLLALLEVPAVVTRYGLRRAASADPAEQSRAVRFLRVFGDREDLLRACYWRQGSAGLLGAVQAVFEPIPAARAREVFYRVTGDPFDTIPAERAGPWGRGLSFDPDVGGTTIGGRIQGLSLHESRLDGSVDAQGGVSYVEWTMSLRNDSARQQESRAQVQMPHGAVVSRATLWISGEEREAAFGGRAQVRQAYQRVVSARRDPLLVTTSGPGSVLIQCFPVQPHSEMKIRIGITAPLAVAPDGRSQSLALPLFAERNFTVDPSLQHSIWLESKSRLTSSHAGLTASPGQLRGRVRNLAEAAVELPQAPAEAVWSEDPRDSGSVTLARRVTRLRSTPRRVALVMDGSKHLASAVPHVTAALAALRAPVHTRLFIASEDVVSDDRNLERRLTSTAFAGGTDSIPALAAAHEFAADPRDAIVWVHGSQPSAFGNIERLLQMRQRRPVRMFAVRAAGGPNSILAALDRDQLVEAVAPAAGLERQLRTLFTGWGGGPGWEYEHVPKNLAALPSVRTSDHLSRLWAFQEVLRRAAANRNEDASDLARAYQLVTPASGAVVLETAQQYQQHGLQPVERGTVPTVPEPEAWELLLAAIVVLLLAFRRKSCPA
ncbi:MAG: VIT domain-containing protein [Bryobacteraceae bacterium]